MAIKASFPVGVAAGSVSYLLTNLAFLWLDNGEKGGPAIGLFIALKNYQPFFKYLMVLNSS